MCARTYGKTWPSCNFRVASSSSSCVSTLYALSKRSFLSRYESLERCAIFFPTPRPLAPVLSLFLSLSPPQYTHCPGRCLDSFRDSINKETMKETWSYLIADVAQSCFRLFSNRPMVMRSVHGQYFDAVRSVYTDCLESESKSAQPKRFELIVNKWQCSQKLCIQNNSRQVNASPRWGHSISRHVDVLIRSNYEVNHSKS